MMKTKVTKAVFPVAGLGTRFLPATKASPKEMLCVVDKPLIQYAVEEAAAAGITDMIFVTGRNKRAIEDHFDKAYELEMELAARNKKDLLETVRSVKPAGVKCIYVRQAEALGLGHAILCAEHLINDEPFAVILADDLIDAQVPVLRQMTEVHARYGGNVIGVETIAPAQCRSYGVVAGAEVGHGLHRLHSIVEKPAPEDAPSDLGVVGRYVLTPTVFRYLREARPGNGGEIQLTDAIAALLKEETVLAYEFDGLRYDCGTKLGYLQATVDLALKHRGVGEGFADFLASREQRSYLEKRITAWGVSASP
jgi:UTP--glucose-1-phosphate uridylyltransferase